MANYFHIGQPQETRAKIRAGLAERLARTRPGRLHGASPAKMAPPPFAMIWTGRGGRSRRSCGCKPKRPCCVLRSVNYAAVKIIVHRLLVTWNRNQRITMFTVHGVVRGDCFISERASVRRVTFSVSPRCTPVATTSITARACSRLVNQCSFRHSSRSRPLNDSTYAFRFGLPGWMGRRVMPLRCAQLSIALPLNSGPLSERITAGRPRW
jgi:hypothetical protein